MRDGVYSYKGGNMWDKTWLWNVTDWLIIEKSESEDIWFMNSMCYKYTISFMGLLPAYFLGSFWRIRIVFMCNNILIEVTPKLNKN